jgi:hypothetical protein
VPDAGLDIDSYQVSTDYMCAGDAARVVESEKRNFAVEDEERFGFGRIEVAVRGDVGAFDHHVEEAVWIIFHAGVKIVIGSEAGGLAGAFD